MSLGKYWAEFNIYFVKEQRAWKDTQPTSAGVLYPTANALVEANNRESETMYSISLLASYMSSDPDTYFNLSGMVASLMSKLLISNKNLVMALKENIRLELFLIQCQRTGGTGKV